ncbi:hypothetical protein WISP_138509 [Willisornis vidua]|uniref:Uncharacterized protein n=1 Tax=Willisornis vidua TaxID=1566151 RepID=A0ABQ9CMZ1_9PASS|nr:hypothetical protein WISP_138509 [Willisornis vidua]
MQKPSWKREPGSACVSGKMEELKSLFMGVTMKLQWLTQCQYTLKDEQMKSNPVEKDLGVMVNKRLDTSWQDVLAALKVLHQKQHGQQVEGVNMCRDQYGNQMVLSDAVPWMNVFRIGNQFTGLVRSTDFKGSG